MPVAILMPALSPTMESGSVARWLVAVGDRVESGDIVAEIETDKAVMEIEAVESGHVGRLLVEAGDDAIAVNTPIALLMVEGDDEAALDAAVAQPVASAVASSPAPPPQPSATAMPPPAVSTAVNGAPDIDRPDRSGRSGRIFATPLARRLAVGAGLDLHRLSGSGPHGRIVKADVEAAAATQSSATAPAASAERGAERGLAFYDADSYTIKPHDGMRRAIAARLSESKQTIPHFYLTRDYEIDALLALRKTIQEQTEMAGEAVKISVNDFIIRGMALALRDLPEANVSWHETGMLWHAHSDVGVAVALEHGLVTPIIRRAETKNVHAIAVEIKELAARARARKLRPEEYQGGTTAISNLGMFGVREFAAVINPPQATILAVGAGTSRAIIRDGAVVAATVMTVTLSCDHRAVDGVIGARLLEGLRRYIENPVLMLL